MNAFKKTVVPGTLEGGKVYVEIEWDGKKLSISGHDKYSSGQIDLEPEEITPASGWNKEMITRLKNIWELWHLNDMHAGCEHQRAEGWGKNELTLVTYEIPKLVSGVTSTNIAQLEGHMKGLLGKFRTYNIWELVNPIYSTHVAKPKSPDDPRVLWFAEKFNCKRKEEKKKDGWVRPEEHPDGKLCKPCSVCGYKYGTSWLHEDVPEDVLQFLNKLPEIQTAGKSTYEIEAEEFLNKYGVTFKAVFKGDKCPLWCDGNCNHGDRYVVTFRRKDSKSLSMSFWNSMNDSENGKAPSVYDVLAAMEKYDPEDFEDWCSNLGYESNSRKAEKTYKLVVKEYEKVSAFFTEEELEEMQDIN